MSYNNFISLFAMESNFSRDKAAQFISEFTGMTYRISHKQCTDSNKQLSL